MKLEVKDARCGYSKDASIMEHIDFSVESGEICCVLGPNGVGKTTLFRSVLGLLPLLAGKVLVDGEDISRWSAARTATTMAYVAQTHVPPFPYRVKDVVLLGRVNKIGHSGKASDEDYRIAEDAMKSMGVYDMRDKAYTDISGGELQLVMIARALAQEPKMLVLDEPTAALDYGNVIRVIDKVRALAQQGFAIIMTTHSPDHAFMCNSNVLLLQRDEPMKFGSAADIITERNMKQAYGVNVNIVEFVNSRGEIMRMCAPLF